MNIDSMIQGNPQALVTSYNGVLVADSLEVADRFGKAHKNVVRDIENLMDGIESNRLNFEPIAEKEYFIPDFYTGSFCTLKPLTKWNRHYEAT